MRPAAENAGLTAELARMKGYVEGGERTALLGEVDALRAELLRLDESVKKLSTTPEVRGEGGGGGVPLECRQHGKTHREKIS